MSKLSFGQILKLSRPRFWIYELWSYILWISAALYIYLMRYGNIDFSQSQIFMMVWMGIYFLFPANLYIYGINDIYDYETDKNNPKKQWYEILLTPDKHLYSWILILIFWLPFLISQIFLTDNYGSNIVWWLFLWFLFFAGFYSAKPIRAKAIPVLDMVFSWAHYTITALYGFVLVMWEFTNVNRRYFLAAMCRCMAMHAYSAAPDITADKEAGLSTVATLFGYNLTLALCILLYIASAYFAYGFLGIYGVIAVSIYVLFMVLSLIFPKKVFSYYKVFSWLNLIVWFVIFCLIAYKFYFFKINI